MRTYAIDFYLHRKISLKYYTYLGSTNSILDVTIPKRSTSLGQILITHNIHNKKSQLYDRIKTSLAAFYF